MYHLGRVHLFLVSQMLPFLMLEPICRVDTTCCGAKLQEIIEYSDTTCLVAGQPKNAKIEHAILRVTLSGQLSRLRQIYSRIADPGTRAQLRDELGSECLEPAATDAAARAGFRAESGHVGVGHVKELCRQIEQLVVQLGPLCALLALYACFEPDSDSTR